MNNRKYYIIVRLFKGWKPRLDLFGGCKMVYNSMRVELNTMDFGDDTNWQFIKWRLLHQALQMDTLYRVNPTSESELADMYKHLPFDILVKTGLTRVEALELEERLHTAIYPDPTPSDDEITEENYYSASYKTWMEGYKNALNEFKDVIELPSDKYDEFNPELNIM